MAVSIGMLEEMIAKLDNAEAPDAKEIINQAREIITHSSKRIRKALIEKYEPILESYEKEYHLN